jgi:hypothetical protein
MYVCMVSIQSINTIYQIGVIFKLQLHVLALYVVILMFYAQPDDGPLVSGMTHLKMVS